MQADTYNIMDFGATGDNETLNTKAFGNAISSAFDNYDIFCRYVDDLELRDIRYIWSKPEKPEWGSAMRFVEVNDLVVDGFQGRQAMDSGKPAVELRKVKNALFRNCVAPEGAGTFLKADEACSRISLMNNDLGYAEKMYEAAGAVVCK